MFKICLFKWFSIVDHTRVRPNRPLSTLFFLSRNEWVSVTFAWKWDNNKCKRVIKYRTQPNNITDHITSNKLAYISFVCWVSSQLLTITGTIHIEEWALNGQDTKLFLLWIRTEEPIYIWTPLTITIKHTLWSLRQSVNRSTQWRYGIDDGVSEMKITYLRLTAKSDLVFPIFLPCNAHSSSKCHLYFYFHSYSSHWKHLHGQNDVIEGHRRFQSIWWNK